MRRLGLLLLSGALLAGCAQLSGTDQSIWSLLEKQGQAEPKLTDYEQGKRNLQLGNLGLAISAFQKELALNPNSTAALNGIAIAYDRLGRHDIAQRYLDLALALDPKSVVTLNNYAYLNLTQGNTEVALDYGERARAAASAVPADMPLPNTIANAVEHNNEFARALAMSEAQDMVARQALEPFDMPGETTSVASSLVRLNERQWELSIPAMAMSSVTENLNVPQLTPVSINKPAEWTAELPRGSKIRVTNVTGRNLMAARFAGYLGEHGLNVRQLANGQTFSYKQSVIYYNPDQKEFAEKLAQLLPFGIRLAEAKNGMGQVEIILGSDLLPFDTELQAG